MTQRQGNYRFGSLRQSRAHWIESVPGIKGGAPVIKGTRITVHAVEARLLNGDSLDEIAAENPDVPREAFAAAVALRQSASPPRLSPDCGLRRRGNRWTPSSIHDLDFGAQGRPAFHCLSSAD